MVQKIEPYDYHREFYYCSTDKCRYFTKLMYLIITRKNIKMDIKKLSNICVIKKIRSKINHQNEEGWTALMIAVTVIIDGWCSYQTIKLLLKNGADPNMIEKNSWTALTLTIHNWNKQYGYYVVKLLINYGADINYLDKDNWTPLIFACRSTNIHKTVGILLDRKVNIEIKDKNGRTPLMFLYRFRCQKH